MDAYPFSLRLVAGLANHSVFAASNTKFEMSSLSQYLPSALSSDFLPFSKCPQTYRARLNIINIIEYYAWRWLNCLVCEYYEKNNSKYLRLDEKTLTRGTFKRHLAPVPSGLRRFFQKMAQLFLRSTEHVRILEVIPANDNSPFIYFFFVLYFLFVLISSASRVSIFCQRSYILQTRHCSQLGTLRSITFQLSDHPRRMIGVKWKRSVRCIVIITRTQQLSAFWCFSTNVEPQTKVFSAIRP